MSDYFIISVDKATADQLNRIHGLVKLHANGWWHSQSNLWIAGGKDTLYWRDLVKTLISGTSARVLVLRLPSLEDGRWWGSFALTDEASSWLKRNYTKRAEAKKLGP
jgi:hypothetical protein